MEAIYQTREAVLHPGIQHREVESSKYDAHRSQIFYENRGDWITDETLSRVFNKSSQSKYIVRRKRISKSSKSMIIKTGYPNLLQGCDFLCFDLMNY